MGNELFEQTLPAYAQDRAGRIDPHARSVKPRAVPSQSYQPEDAMRPVASSSQYHTEP